MNKMIFALFLGMMLFTIHRSVLAEDDTIEGRVKTVDIFSRRLEIDSVTETEWVNYSAKTKLPNGVTDISMLAGRTVKITFDDAGRAAKVEDS